MRTSLSRVLLCVVLLSLTLSGCQNGGSNAPLGMKAAAPDFAAYELFVPEGWTVTETGGAVAAYASNSDPTSVSLMSWSLPYTDTTLEEWWAGYQTEFLVVFTDFSLTSEEDTLLSGVPARKYVYTATLGANSYRYTQYAAARGGVLYLMTFTELAGASVDHSEDIAAIAGAFTFKDGGAG